MKPANFIVAGIAGGIADFLFGWLTYGIIFFDFFGGDEMKHDLVMIGFGCLSFGFLISLIWTRWANMMRFGSGLVGGAVIGLIMGLMMNFFHYSMMPLDLNRFVVDVLIQFATGAIVGGIVATVNGAMTNNRTA